MEIQKRSKANKKMLTLIKTYTDDRSNNHRFTKSIKAYFKR